MRPKRALAPPQLQMGLARRLSQGDPVESQLVGGRGAGGDVRAG